MKILNARTIALLACLTLAWSACGEDSDGDGAGGSGGSDAGAGGTGGRGGTGGTGGSGGKGGGGGGSTASCDQALAGFQACGGDPSGTWSMELFCAFGDELIEDCPEADMNFEFPEDMRIVFQGGTVETLSQGMATIRVTAPTSCLEVETCEEVDAMYQWMGGSCSGSAEACTCELSSDEFVELDQATYRVDGNRMTIEDDEGETVYEYCVQGSTMTLRHIAEDGEEDEGLLVLKRN